MNLTDKLIDTVFNLNKPDYSAFIIEKSKQILIDYIAVTHAGYTLQKSKLLKYIDNLDSSKNLVKIIGSSIKTNIQNASFINGFSSHVADYDDGSNTGIIHIGSPVLSALLPVAIFNRLDGKVVLNGILAGYETAYRIANSIQPSHKILGYHATGTIGALGAVVAICISMKLSKEQTKNAFTLCALSSSGSLKVLEDNSELKPLNVARASSLAVNSFLLSYSKFHIPNDVLSGEYGFLNQFSKKSNPEKLYEIHEELGIQKTYFKLHASCRYTHPAVDAVIFILENNSLKYQNIVEIIIETYDIAIKNHDHIKIFGTTSAKMSIPYSVAVAVLTGNADISKFTEEYIHSEPILEIMKLITIVQSDKFSNEFPDKQCANVSIITKDKTKYEHLVEFPKGEPNNPLSSIQVEDKYRKLMKFSSYDNNYIEKLLKSIKDFEKNSEEFYDLL